MSAADDDDRSPYEFIGEAGVRGLAERFYDHMDAHEPALAALHELENGRGAPKVRERFFWFLSGWLGGPQMYMERIGHPRLRMRHARVAIDQEMRDAWMHCMSAALNAIDMPPAVRDFLRTRFDEVATFLINR